MATSTSAITPDCANINVFMLEVAICSINFPPAGYTCWDLPNELNQEDVCHYGWWEFKNQRVCCLASAASSASAATSASAARTYIKTNPITPAGSITARPSVLMTSTSRSAQRQTTSPKDISTSSITPAGSLSISPPKISEDSKSYPADQSKSYPAERNTAFIAVIVCVLTLIVLCAVAACFVALRKKKRIGNEPPRREQGARMVAA
jgi:cobalamin biosynthesis Mg chelatase CobN